jgi:hypothetical protein
MRLPHGIYYGLYRNLGLEPAVRPVRAALTNGCEPAPKRF